MNRAPAYLANARAMSKLVPLLPLMAKIVVRNNAVPELGRFLQIWMIVEIKKKSKHKDFPSISLNFRPLIKLAIKIPSRYTHPKAICFINTVNDYNRTKAILDRKITFYWGLSLILN